MKLTQLRLKNFKLFTDISLDLKPITLLTGVNSSGKSSILTSLATVIQTPAPNCFPLDIVLNGDNCHLGCYKDVVHGHSTKTNFDIGFCADHKGKKISIDASFRYSPHGDHVLPKEVRYEVNLDFIKLIFDEAHGCYKCSLSAPSYAKIIKDKNIIAFYDSLIKIINENKNIKNNKNSDEIKKSLFFDNFTSNTNIKSGNLAKNIWEDIASTPLGHHLVEKLRNSMSEVRSHMGYVGPIRAMPQRYYNPDQPHFVIDAQGNNCAQLLHDWKTHCKRKFDLVTSFMLNLELIEKVKTQNSVDEILKILVTPFSRTGVCNLVDVGFGVSQALPMIVSDVALPDDEGVLLVNQPEVHLHPTSQAKLANHFVSRIKNRQYIIETHSEYIINRLRVLVMKGELAPSEVNIIFLETNTRGRSKLNTHVINIRPDGGLDNAPKSFFDTYYVDSFELAMGKMEKLA